VSVRELENLLMELESAYNAAPHLYILLTYIDEEDRIDRELKEKLRQLSLLCSLLRNELDKIEKEADMIGKAKRWG
jgi:uncharacterized membrane protein YgaE (UPF0421/DUF939 family)